MSHNSADLSLAPDLSLAHIQWRSLSLVWRCLFVCLFFLSVSVSFSIS